MGAQMKIVGILQNQWFKNPAKIKRLIAEKESEGFADAREFYIATFLFWGCLTGRRLRATLGEDYCNEIVWEECSREMGNSASSRFPADLKHIQQVIAKHKPDVVIAFGQLAKDALLQIYQATPHLTQKIFTLLLAPHPAARQGDVLQQLRNLRKLLDDESLLHKETDDANLHRLDSLTEVEGQL